MDNEILAEVPAPEQEATAAPEPEVNSPEVSTEQTDQPAEKTYTQAEIDAMIGKRLAREQRKWEREQAQRAEEVQARQQAGYDITPDQFETYEDYAEVLAERKAEELLARRDTARQQAEMQDAYHDLEEAARDKYDDFEQVAYNPKLPITNVMAETIQSSDVLSLIHI